MKWTPRFQCTQESDVLNLKYNCIQLLLLFNGNQKKVGETLKNLKLAQDVVLISCFKTGENVGMSKIINIKIV